MKLAKTLSRLALQRGMKAGSREWLATGAVLGLASWTKRRHEDQKNKVLHRETLEPGEAVSIRVIDPQAEKS